MTARFHWLSRHTNYPFPLCTQRGKGWKATLRQKKRPKATRCQFGTAGMTARFHWLSRHTNYPFPLCTQRGKGWKATLRQKKRPKATAFSPVSFFRILRITQKKCNVSLLLVYFQSTNLILFFILIWRRGMIPSLQSPMHGYRLRHLSQKKCNVSLLLVYFQSTNLILFFILIWRRGMIPSLQSPMHGYRLRHLSARVALQPCAYSTGECFITTF